MRKILRLKIVAALLLFTSIAWAQTRTVSGKVTSKEDGSTIPGVNVVVKGTSNGTTTDADGKYSLSVPDAGGILVFSFIGLASQELEIGQQTIIDASMASDATQLSEVVVVGYGTQSKHDLSGTIATVDGSKIKGTPVQSFDQALAGRAPGVNATSPNGVIGNPPVIRIRGVNSINLSSFPLVVVDGVPTYTGNNSFNSAGYNPLANINPSDIQSIDILKDASATAIYGSRAAAGVILVTTKRGASGKAKITYDAWAGWTSPFRLFKLLDAQQYMDIKNEALTNAGQPQGFFPTNDANGNMINTDWYKYVYRTGFAHSNALGISGGNESTTYYASLNYTGQDGMLKNNNFDRVQLRLNLDQKVFKNFSVGTNFSFSNSNTASPNTGSLSGQAFNTAGLGRLPLVTAPNVGPYLSDGSYNVSGSLIGTMNNLQQSGFYNPVVILDKDYFKSIGNQIQASAYAKWEIIKGLTVKTLYGIDRLDIENRSYQNPLNGDGFSVGGSATNTYSTNHRWNWQNTVQYDFNLQQSHNFSVLIGGEQQYSKFYNWGAQRTGVGDPFFTVFEGNFTNITPVNLGNTENFLVSYFGRVNYDFNKKYFATVNVRRDGYSAFANKYGNFYGASLGYAISEESFFKDSPLASTVSFLKLKASYGQVGNNQGINDFASLQLYGTGLYGADPTLTFGQAGNNKLTWETSKKLDVGLSFGLLQDRIQGEITYYKNTVDGLILAVPQSPSKGIPGNSILANIGSMQNSGIEISVQATAIQSGDFTWKMGANVTSLKNEVTALDNPNSIIRTSTSGLETSNITKVGQSIGSLNVVQTVGVDQTNGRRIFLKADGTQVEYDHSAPSASRWTNVSDGSVTTAPNTTVDGKIYGPTLPKYYGGFDNTFSYKNFDLGVFIQFQGGNYIYNGTQAGLRDMRFWNNSTDVLNRWTPSNTTGTIPRVVWTDNVSNGSSFPISENIQKGDFARLRNVTLGYRFPKAILDRVKVSSARVYVQVQNALIVTSYKGIDPENSANGNSTASAGIDRNSVGQARTFTVGINLGF
ncbi:MAG: TonB-dependent receptor [Bacteroidetes bacterium]|nr:TonB-dependent receptor [Bacteroidota bacterium]